MELIVIAIIVLCFIGLIPWYELNKHTHKMPCWEFFFGPGHPLNEQPIKITRKGLFYWVGYTQKRVVVAEDDQRVCWEELEVTGEDGTVEKTRVSTAYTVDNRKVMFAVWKIQGVFPFCMKHTPTDKMPLLGEVNPEHLNFL